MPSGQIVGFFFALVRTTAWLSICPPFNSPTIPKRVRVGLATAISFTIAATIGGDHVASLQLGPFVVALLTQIVAGLALGFAVYVLFAAIQAAGELIDLQVGFSLGAVLDPISGASASPIGRFHQLLAIVILFGIDGHVLIVRGYLRSVEAVPLGTLDLGQLTEQLMQLLRVFLAAAVEIGLPVLAALFLAEIALGLLGKAAPQMNILVMGFAVKSFIAIMLLALTIVLLPETVESLIGQAIRAGGRAFGG
ncbi:MAG: flagellar biosynthetic protein FliR [Ilumatobacter sp.]|uniref:flagellar biosynthetic protein FliR n=1 Tax=Ilumatobacter sp. TaxID=1967498 RepID=UPI00391D8110